MAGRVSSPVFVGRAGELELLLAAAEGARTAGGPRLVLVDGEAGVGKSRLVAEFATQAAGLGMTVASGSCLALGEEGVPYAPFTELIRRLYGAELQLRALVEDRGGALARLIPEVTTGASMPEGAGADDRAALFDAVVTLLDLVAGREGRSLLLILEDVHWADRSSRDLLDFILHRAQGPLLVVATCRGDELDSRHPLRTFLAEARRSGLMSRVELARLDRSQVFDLLAAILGSIPGAELVDDVWSRSEGNPFLAEELVALARSGHLSGFPGSLRDVVLARTASLDDATQHMLRVAAVGGRRVDDRLLGAVAGMGEDEVAEATRRATDAAVLHADPTDGRLAFRHALLHEAMYAELLPGERRRHHLAFGRVLAAHPDWAGHRDDVAAELAHHFHAGADLPRALEASLAAARAAESRTAFPEASRHYQRAVDVWDDVPEAATIAAADRLAVLERAVDVAVLGGAIDRAVTLVRAMLGLVDDPVRQALLHERLARLLWLAGDAEGSVAETDQAVRLVSSSPPSPERARIVAADAHALLLAARYPESRARAAEAVELAQSAGVLDLEGYARNTLGVVSTYLGDSKDGFCNLQRAREIAEQLARVDDLQRAYFNLATAAATVGRLNDALVTALEGAAAVAGRGFKEGSGYLYRKAAEYQVQLGRWDEAAAQCRRVLELVRTPVTLVQAHTIAGTLAVRRGRLDAARSHMDSATAMSAELAGGWFHGWLLCARAELELATGHADAATAAVEEGLDAVGGTDAEVLLRRLAWLGVRAHALRAETATVQRAAELDAARGRAQELVARVEVAAARMRARGVGPYAEGQALELSTRAELAGTGGVADAPLWSEAARAWSELAQPYETAVARWREGAALLSTRGDRRTAEEALRAARSTAAGLGAEPLRAAVEDLGRRARLDLSDRAGPSSVDPEDAASPAEAIGLTKREAEVLGLVAAGRSNRQIAEALFMSEKTASVHVSRILTKLAVTSRGEAAALAHRLGLVG